MTRRKLSQAERLPEGAVVQARPQRVFLDAQGKPLVPDEGHNAIGMARHLHAILPGANPRQLVKARPGRYGQKGTPAIMEEAHPWAAWWHVPNEGARTKHGGKFTKDMGLRAGVYDLAFVFRLPEQPLPIAQAAFIEQKRPDGGSGRSDEQQAFSDHMNALGAWTAECWTVEELDATLRAWLAPYGLAPRQVPILPMG